jgi:hypothetical protein
MTLEDNFIIKNKAWKINKQHVLPSCNVDFLFIWQVIYYFTMITIEIGQLSTSVTVTLKTGFNHWWNTCLSFGKRFPGAIGRPSKK